MCQRCYQVETDSRPRSLRMPASEYSAVHFTIYCTWALVHTIHRVRHSFLLFPPNLFCFFSFSCRTKQRPTIRATSTPGSSKPWRPRRTGSDELGRPHPQEGRETETKTGNEIGTVARRPHPRQLFLRSWIQAQWRERVSKQKASLDDPSILLLTSLTASILLLLLRMLASLISVPLLRPLLDEITSSVHLILHPLVLLSCVSVHSHISNFNPHDTPKTSLTRPYVPEPCDGWWTPKLWDCGMSGSKRCCVNKGAG